MVTVIPGLAHSGHHTLSTCSFYDPLFPIYKRKGMSWPKSLLPVLQRDLARVALGLKGSATTTVGALTSLQGISQEAEILVYDVQSRGELLS